MKKVEWVAVILPILRIIYLLATVKKLSNSDEPGRMNKVDPAHSTASVTHLTYSNSPINN